MNRGPGLEMYHYLACIFQRLTMLGHQKLEYWLKSSIHFVANFNFLSMIVHSLCEPFGVTRNGWQLLLYVAALKELWKRCPVQWCIYCDVACDACSSAISPRDGYAGHVGVCLRKWNDGREYRVSLTLTGHRTPWVILVSQMTDAN